MKIRKYVVKSGEKCDICTGFLNFNIKQYERQYHTLRQIHWRRRQGFGLIREPIRRTTRHFVQLIRYHGRKDSRDGHDRPA